MEGCLSLLFFQLMVEDGFTNSAITSIERRFQLRSQDIGIILSIYEFTVIISIIPVTYFGGRGNKPRWISIGCFLMGVASLLFALPHFTTERYAYFSEKGTEQATCRLHEANSSSTSSVDSCMRNGKSISSLSRYIILFGAAKVIAGIGATPQGSLGIVFLDESITTKQNGMYLSKSKVMHGVAVWAWCCVRVCACVCMCVSMWVTERGGYAWVIQYNE